MIQRAFALGKDSLVFFEISADKRERVVKRARYVRTVLIVRLAFYFNRVNLAAVDVHELGVNAPIMRGERGGMPFVRLFRKDLGGNIEKFELLRKVVCVIVDKL